MQSPRKTTQCENHTTSRCGVPWLVQKSQQSPNRILRIGQIQGSRRGRNKKKYAALNVKQLVQAGLFTRLLFLGQNLLQGYHHIQENGYG